MDENFCQAHALYTSGKEHFQKGTHTDAYECWIKAISMVDPLRSQSEGTLKADLLTVMASLEMTRARWGSAFDMLTDACRLNPKKPSCFVYLAQVNFMLGRPKEAIANAEYACALPPPVSALAWQTLGNIHLKTGNRPKAIEAYAKAADTQPDEVGHYLMLAHTWQWGGDREEAKKWYYKALELVPEHPDVNFHFASFLLEDCEYEESRERFLKAAKKPANCEQSLWNVSLISLLLGEYETAWEQYEVRKQFIGNDLGEEKAHARNSRPLWNGEKGATVHLHAEQGNGDALQFCRYVPMVAALGNNVVFETFDTMVPLMRHNFPQAKVIGIAKNYPGIDGIPDCEYHCPLMSLPRAFKTTLETIPGDPYITAEPHFEAKWKAIVDKACGESWEAVRIGLCWAGGKRPDSPDCMRIDSRRSLTFSQIKPLLGRKNTAYVSLQIGPAQNECDDPAVHDFSKDIESWSDTAGLIANLDFVVSVDTAVLHLAAAMGKDTFLLNRFDTCWRWLLDRDDSPWYPSLTQFRQTKMGEWDDVIERVREAMP